MPGVCSNQTEEFAAASLIQASAHLCPDRRSVEVSETFFHDSETFPRFPLARSHAATQLAERFIQWCAGIVAAATIAGVVAAWKKCIGWSPSSSYGERDALFAEWLNTIFYILWGGLAAMTIVAVAWILTQEEEHRRTQRLKRTIVTAIAIGVGTVVIWWVWMKLVTLRFH